MGIAKMLATVTALIVIGGASVPVLSHQEASTTQGQSLIGSGNCPDKWLDASFVDMGCLYFNSSATETWDAANSLCQIGSNSTLVDIATEVQLAFLQMELDLIADHEGATHHWWTAGTDVGTNGRWFWVTTLGDVGEFVWDDNYPNSVDYYNCLALYDHNDYVARNYACTSL